MLRITTRIVFITAIIIIAIIVLFILGFMVMVCINVVIIIRCLAQLSFCGGMCVYLL